MKHLLKRIIKPLLMMFISLYLRKAKKVFLSKRASINHRTFLEGYNKIWEGVSISNSYIGIATYIGKDSLLDNVKIGRFCSIASNVKVVAATHPLEKFVSTHPAFYSTLKQAGFSFVKMQLFDEFRTIKGRYAIIGNDVWIGPDVTLLGGIRIGDGAVILASSVVTKDVEPYSIVGGVPAKLLKYRFEPIMIKKLLEIKWWNWTLEEIKERAQYFIDIESFTAQKVN